MATKIGYVGRDASEQINWAEVGSNFSGILKEEARVREEKKAEIDRATREQMNVLQNVVTGDSANMNTWSLNYGADAQQQLLMANSLLKSGQLKPKDYTIMRQNLADGTDQAMTLAQEYQNEFADKMARAKANPGTAVGPDGKPITGAQDLEAFLMESAEGFGNFSKSKLVINNQTGNVLVGFMNPTTGEIETDPNKLVGINNLRNRIKGKFDAYDMASAVAKAKAEFGMFQTIDRKIGNAKAQGLLTTYNDMTLRTQASIDKMVEDGILNEDEAKLYSTFEKTEDLWTESQLSNVYNISSLLTDNLGGSASNGEKYTFTWNADEENENTILLKEVDGTAVPNFDSAIGKAHRDRAKEGLRLVLRGALDHESESRSVDDYTAPTYRSRSGGGRGRTLTAEEQVDYNLQLDWNSLYSMTTEERISRLTSLLNTDKANELGIRTIRISPKNNKFGDKEGVRFVYDNGDVLDFPMNFDDMTEEDWAEAGSGFAGNMSNQQRTEAGGFGGNWNKSPHQAGSTFTNTRDLKKKTKPEETPVKTPGRGNSNGEMYRTPEGDKLFQ